jgi:hypothetical protein
MTGDLSYIKEKEKIGREKVNKKRKNRGFGNIHHSKSAKRPKM